MKTQLISLAVAIGISAHVVHAEDYEVGRYIEITSSPEEAWNMIGDFCDIDDWHPAVNLCTLKVIDGALHRVLLLANGAEFVEKLIAVEPGISYTYKIVSSPLPIEKYTATLSITRAHDTTINWSGRFSSDEPEMESVIADIYETGLAAIETRLE